MVLEQSEAKRQRALRGSEIESTAEKLHKLGALLRNTCDATQRTAAYNLLRSLADAGGLDHLHSIICEFDSLSCKIGTISRTLEESGIRR